jgi:hypothetical protein
VATGAVLNESDDEDVEYSQEGHFCSGCSIPPPLVVDLVVCVGRFVGMEVLGCWNLDLGVSAVETTIERV